MEKARFVLFGSDEELVEEYQEYQELNQSYTFSDEVKDEETEEKDIGIRPC